MEPQEQLLTPAEEGGCNDEISKVVHQARKVKLQPRTLKTPNIIIPGPSKKGVETCEGSNVLKYESVSESPLERKLKK